MQTLAHYELQRRRAEAAIYWGGLITLLALAVLLFGCPAWAQDTAAAAAPGPSLGSKLLELLSPGTVGTVLSLVAGAIGGLAFLTARRKKFVALGAYYAFHIVEDIGNEIEGPDGFDKTAEYLKQLDAYMVANGWRPLKPGEQDLAKLTAQALHGAEVAKAKVAIAAAEAASPSPQ
jgi:hypothetical protein